MRTKSLLVALVAALSVFATSCKDSQNAEETTESIAQNTSSLSRCAHSGVNIDNITGQSSVSAYCLSNIGRYDQHASIYFSCSESMILAIVFDDFITAEPEFHSITFRGNEDQEAYEFLGLVSSDHKTVMFSSTEENSAMQRIFQSLESSDLLYARTVDYQGRQINIEVPVNGLSEIIKADACMSRNLNIPIAE